MGTSLEAGSVTVATRKYSYISICELRFEIIIVSKVNIVELETPYFDSCNKSKHLAFALGCICKKFNGQYLIVSRHVHCCYMESEEIGRSKRSIRRKWLTFHLHPFAESLYNANGLRMNRDGHACVMMEAKDSYAVSEKLPTAVGTYACGVFVRHCVIRADVTITVHSGAFT